MKHIAPILLIAIFISSCSKEKRFERKLEGTWNVVMIEGGDYYTGDCGTPQSVNPKWTEENVGVYVFLEGEPQFAGTDDDAQPGYKEFDYVYTDPDFGGSYTVQYRLDFDWYIVDDQLVIHNPDEFLFEDHVLDEFNKKEWEIVHAEGDECDGVYTKYYLSKE